MSLARPDAGRPRRSRWGLLAGLAIVGAVLAYLALSGVGSAFVYYRTPGELLALGDSAHGQTVRLGGLVAPGSMAGSGTDLRFELTDGTATIPVHTAVAPPALLREGIGAVVEGSLGVDGVFEATSVIVKHDENYQAPSPGAIPADRSFVPGDG
jgi:cytochrome c-type biogenesis protein CcmE